jgi:hypothetical protein
MLFGTRRNAICHKFKIKREVEMLRCSYLTQITTRLHAGDCIGEDGINSYNGSELSFFF